MTFSGPHVLTVFVLRPIKKTDLELLKLYCWKQESLSAREGINVTAKYTNVQTIKFDKTILQPQTFEYISRT